MSSTFARGGRIAVATLLVAGALTVASREPLRRWIAPPESATLLPVVPAAAAGIALPVADRPPEAALSAVSRADEDELATLRRGLVVPVAGIERSQLRDSYAEPRGGRLHEAMDILAPTGTPVLSAADGTVVKLFDSAPGGLMVYASDPSGRFILLYGHLDRYADGLADGASLARGQVIGYVGTSGNADVATPHLHFAILRGDPQVAWWIGVPLNPYPLLSL